MILASRRAYVDSVKWIKEARPRRIDTGRFAARCLWWSLCAGIVVLGLIGLLSPSAFAGPTARSLSSGIWTIALAATVAVFALAILTRLRHARWVVARIREPLSRPLENEHGFEGAAAALAECPAPLRTRFALSWVLWPGLLAVAGVTFSFAVAYFVISAIVSQFEINWQHPLFAAVWALAAYGSFLGGARRLSTWRIATSAYFDSTGRYVA